MNFSYRTVYICLSLVLGCASYSGGAMEKPAMIPEEVIQNGDLEGVKYFLNNGADVNYRYANSNTALHCATAFGHSAIVEKLLNRGADVNACNALGFTPLMYANTALLAGELIRAGANVNYMINGSGRTVLHSAVIYGFLTVVKKLIDEDAEVNCMDCNGRTPLWYAASHGNLDIVQELINNGAIDFADKSGVTAEAISYNCHFKIYDFLCNVPENIFKAIWKNDLPAVKRFIKNPKNIECTYDEYSSWEYDKKTPLHYAAEKGYAEIVQELLNYGASVNRRCRNGYTPLKFASSNRHLKTVQTLLRCKDIDLECTDTLKGCGDTALSSAAANGYLEIVQELISHGAHINCTNYHGLTPLHEACIHGHLNIVQELVKNGAKLECIDNQGETALAIAQNAIKRGVYPRENYAAIAEFLSHEMEKPKKIFLNRLNAHPKANLLTCNKTDKESPKVCALLESAKTAGNNDLAILANSLLTCRAQKLHFKDHSKKLHRLKKLANPVLQLKEEKYFPWQCAIRKFVAGWSDLGENTSFGYEE
jgi:ankyrin repeat protein